MPNAGVDPTVVASKDFSHVYFTSSRQLVPGQGVAGEQNLYAWHDGQVDFVATTGQQLSYSGLGSNLTSSENGETAVFSSSREHLTGDDTTGLSETYLYREGGPSMECVSCPQGSAATFPGGAAENLSADGQIYAFITREPISPRDVNNQDDIYEWRDGKIVLVTDGVGEFPIGLGRLEFVAMSDSGMNILFMGGRNLTGYERDGAGQLYSAWLGGGFPPPPPPPASCAEDSCQGPLSQAPGGSAPPAIRSAGRATSALKARSRRRTSRRKRRKRSTAGRRRSLPRRTRKGLADEAPDVADAW